MRAQFWATCQEILQRPEWPERVRAAHRSADPVEQDRAWRLSSVVGVDLWEEEFARLRSDPLNAGIYGNVMRTNDPVRIDRVIAHAEESLPLDEIGSGPSDDLGLGPAFRPHTCLVMLLRGDALAGRLQSTAGPRAGCAVRWSTTGSWQARCWRIIPLSNGGGKWSRFSARQPHRSQGTTFGSGCSVCSGGRAIWRSERMAGTAAVNPCRAGLRREARATLRHPARVLTGPATPRQDHSQSWRPRPG